MTALVALLLVLAPPPAAAQDAPTEAVEEAVEVPPPPSPPVRWFPRVRESHIGVPLMLGAPAVLAVAGLVTGGYWLGVVGLSGGPATLEEVIGGHALAWSLVSIAFSMLVTGIHHEVRDARIRSERAARLAGGPGDVGVAVELSF